MGLGECASGGRRVPGTEWGGMRGGGVGSDVSGDGPAESAKRERAKWWKGERATGGEGRVGRGWGGGGGRARMEDGGVRAR
jgi:hypothetical protein